MWWSYKPYVSVGERVAKARREIARLQKKGREISPVTVDGRTIARTFWGKAWCDHLATYSDFENRMPRGRSYVRNGMVLDLKMEAGRVTAIVQGSDSIYDIEIKIQKLRPASWTQVKERCAGQIGSILELMQGKFSDHVMRTVTDRQAGLFPSPSEIDLDCSCPDWADMCKHVAAAMYGVGARLDERPELLFVLRGVDPAELILQATHADVVARATRGRSGKKTLAISEAADVFGIELEEQEASMPAISQAKKIVPRVEKTRSPGAAAKVKRGGAPQMPPGGESAKEKKPARGKRRGRARQATASVT